MGIGDWGLGSFKLRNFELHAAVMQQRRLRGQNLYPPSTTSFL